MAGRPSDFTQDIADAICEKLGDGISLRTICLAEDMPAKSTVFRWLSLNKAFSDQYARAREAQADAIFDESLDIADDGSNDYITKTNGDGSTTVQPNTEHIQRSRLRIDTRKWMAGKLAPKKYGDKIALTGADGDGPVRIEHSGQIAKLDATERDVVRQLIERRQQPAAWVEGEPPEE